MTDSIILLAAPLFALPSALLSWPNHVRLLLALFIDGEGGSGILAGEYTDTAFCFRPWHAMCNLRMKDFLHMSCDSDNRLNRGVWETPVGYMVCFQMQAISLKTSILSRIH